MTAPRQAEHKGAFAPPFGPLRKSPLSMAFFAVPALVINGFAVWIAAEDLGSISDALMSPVVLICTVIGAAIVAWGAIFVVRPIVTLTPEAVVWPGGRSLPWADISAVRAGQSTSIAPTGDQALKTVHEVMRLSHGDETTKIVTTWAAIGPQAANDRIEAAFRLSRST